MFQYCSLEITAIAKVQLSIRFSASSCIMCCCTMVSSASPVILNFGRLFDTFVSTGYSG